ncbi:hypothetical protein HHI36_008158 [Cryptolaemus montrouzieri]|uniref:Uncharacterized protein n=1 Tax=Cryptolaemus montrouzieri TaxID=559131 RepID=A0ABD2MS75_9CUCU
MPIQRINTILMDFKSVKKKITQLELKKWIRDTFVFSEDQIAAIQFKHITSKLFIKLVSNVTVKQTVNKFEEDVTFLDSDGMVHKTVVTEEYDEVKVRIFDFPCELDNEKIKLELGKYGKNEGNSVTSQPNLAYGNITQEIMQDNSHDPRNRNQISGSDEDMVEPTPPDSDKQKKRRKSVKGDFNCVTKEKDSQNKVNIGKNIAAILNYLKVKDAW